VGESDRQSDSVHEHATFNQFATNAQQDIEFFVTARGRLGITPGASGGRRLMRSWAERSGVASAAAAVDAHRVVGKATQQHAELGRATGPARCVPGWERGRAKSRHPPITRAAGRNCVADRGASLVNDQPNHEDAICSIPPGSSSVLSGFPRLLRRSQRFCGVAIRPVIAVRGCAG
jgi:hypothetical protein